MSSETLREVKRQRDSAINAVRELVDMIDHNGALACFWCALDTCPADCTHENGRPYFEFGGTMEEVANRKSPAACANMQRGRNQRER